MTQDDDIPGIVRYRTYEVLKEEVSNPKLRWAYLPYSMHMAGPREAIQHMIIRKNYGVYFADCDVSNNVCRVEECVESLLYLYMLRNNHIATDKHHAICHKRHKSMLLL